MTDDHDRVLQLVREAICVKPDCPSCQEPRRLRDDLEARRLIVIKNPKETPT